MGDIDMSYNPKRWRCVRCNAIVIQERMTSLCYTCQGICKMGKVEDPLYLELIEYRFVPKKKRLSVLLSYNLNGKENVVTFPTLSEFYMSPVWTAIRNAIVLSKPYHNCQDCENEFPSYMVRVFHMDYRNANDIKLLCHKCFNERRRGKGLFTPYIEGGINE
jgi:Zn finger protein HypA/HybF involved in hydrogenase expression